MEIKHAITLDTEGLKASANEATNILHGIGQTAEKEGNNIDAAFKKVGAAVAGFFTVQQATQFVRAMVSVRGEIESLEISFRTLVGNKEKADALFGSIREFATSTPLQLNDLAKSAQTLLGYNIEAEKVMPTLKMIGDISMGDAGKLQALTNAFAQMSSTGKLVGQDLMQMINAGFNPLAEISQKTGKSISTLKDEMSKGKISVEMVEEAFKSATSEGGKFYNMLEQQSHGLQGALSNLQGAWNDMLNTVGEKSQSVVLGAVEAATNLVKNFEKIGQLLADIAVTWGVYKAAVIGVNIAKTISIEKAKGYTAAQTLEVKATIAAEKAQKALNKTMLANPYVLAATALATLTMALINANKNAYSLNNETKKLNNAFKECEGEIARERVEIDELFGKLRAAKKGTEDYNAALKDTKKGTIEYDEALIASKKKMAEYDSVKQAIMSKYGQYLSKLGDEKTALDNIAEAYRVVTQEAQKAARARALDAATASAGDTFAEKIGDLRLEMSKMLKDKFGNQAGENYFQQMMEYVNANDFEGLKKKFPEVISKFQSTRRIQTEDGFTDIATNNFSGLIAQMQGVYNTYDATIRRAETMFGTTTKSGFDMSSASVEELDLKIKKCTKTLEEYKKAYNPNGNPQGSGNPAGAQKIKELEEEIAQLEAEKKSRKATSSTSTTTLSDSEKKAQERLAKEKYQREQKIAQYGKEVAKAMTDAEFEIEQATIDGMKEGSDKQLKQIDLNYRKAIEQNERRADEWLEALRDKKEEEWEIANQGHSERVHFDRASVTREMLSSDQLKMLEEYEKIAAAQKGASEKALYEALLLQYESYTQQKLRLSKELAEKEKLMFDEEGNLREGFTMENWDNVVKELNEQFKAIDLAISNEAQTNSELIKNVFANAADQTADKLEANIELAERLLAILQGGYNDLTGADGKLLFTDEQIAAMRKDGDLIKDILQAIIDKKEELSGRKGALGQFADSIKELGEAFKKTGSEKMEGVAKAMEKMLSSAGTLNNAVGDLAGKWKNIAQLTKNQKLEGIASSVEGISNVVGDTMSGIQAGMAIGGPVGGAIMGAISLVTSLFQTSAEHQAQLEAKEKELNEEKLNMQTAYNLLLLEQNKLLEEASNLFKTDSLKAAMGYAQQLADATAMYNGSLSALYGANVRTGSHQEGWWIFGHEVDDYSSLISQWPGLIDETGRLNAELLRNILENQQFQDDAQRAALERLLEYNDAVEEARDNLRSYLSETFGDLADGLMESITKALEDGSDALRNFADDVSDVLRKMGEQLAYSLYFSSLFDQLDKELSEIFENTALSPEELMQQSTELLTQFFNNIGTQVEGAEGFLQQWYQMMEEKGFDAFNREIESAHGIAASQESVDKLDGRMTAVQGHTYMMNENLRIVTANVGAILSSVRAIEENTERISDTLNAVASGVARTGSIVDTMNTRGVKIR